MGYAKLTALLLSFAALILALGGCGRGASTSTATSQHSSPLQTSTQSAAEEQKGGEASIEEFGQEAEGPEREAILSVFTGYLEALADKDYEAACADLWATVDESLAQLSGEGSKAECSAILPELLAPGADRVARQQAEGKMSKVRIEGDRGFVVFHAPGAKLYQQTMSKEGGDWKVATVAAAVLVPDLRSAAP